MPRARSRPSVGPRTRCADFLTTVVAHASDFDRPQDTPGPICFKCRKRDQRRVDTGLTEDDIVVWHCPACGTQGRVPPPKKCLGGDANLRNSHINYTT